MIIGIDCRKIKDGGIGTYLRNLLVEWYRQQVPAKFLLFHTPGDEALFGFPTEFAIRIPQGSPKYSLTELFSFSEPLRKYGADLFYSPHYTLPFRLPCPAVVTVHDLIHLKYRSRFGAMGKGYARFMIRHALKASQVILTDSENSRRDIESFSPSQAAKTRVVYPGVDCDIFRRYPEGEIEVFRKGKSLPDKFILYVGALKPHKNPQSLVEIVNDLNFPLVVATKDKVVFQDILPKNSLKPELLRLVDIGDDNQMALLYNSAWLLIHPAFYEGFGLPPLEAMACGLPVVCADSTSLPEVVGDSALLSDP
jgi:glycosyltransferase involved in cell wall biosynthesis